MTERRKSPIDRCPERTKKEIAHASVERLFRRVILNIKQKQEVK